MSKNPPAFMAEQPVSEDKLKILREMIAIVRVLEFEKSNIEEKLKLVSSTLNQYYQTKLPELFSQCGTNLIGLEKDGDLPAIEAKLVPYYSANIAASWDLERKKAAFKWLTDNKFGDLIKTEISLTFNREDHDKAQKFFNKLKKDDETLNADMKESVNSRTLTAWLKEQIEKYNNVPPLDVIGASVGNIVKLKEV